MYRFLLFVSCLISAVASQAATKPQETITPLADAYIKQHGIKHSVAQLLITGIVADYNNFRSNRMTKELLDLNVGGIMINAYNLPSKSLSETDSRDKALQIVKDFTTTIRRMHRDGSNLLFAADFESYKFSSIRFPLVPPPSSLTITANNSTKVAYDVGNDVGKQLKSVGVNVLLGPVLDKDVNIQGTRNTTLMNRSFGGNEKVISIIASEFIRGIKNHNVAVIAKHFPGYGFAENNPHYTNEVGINATSNTIIKNLLPFKETANIISGVMTSHLYLSKSYKPFTVSNKSLKALIGHKSLYPVSNKIIVTDDISNMASINSYKKKTKINNAKLVINAFEAGHDLILISHLEQHSNNNFTIKDIKDSIDELEEYASSSQGLKRIKTSLEKVLTMKSLISEPSKVDISGKDIDDIHNRFIEVLIKGTINVSASRDQNSLSFIDDLGPPNKIFVVGEEKYFPEMKKILNEDGLIEYRTLSSFNKNRTNPKLQISKMGLRISELVRDGNYLVFLVSNLDSFNILDSLRFNNIDPNRVLISVHGTTMPIKTETLLHFKVISNFDNAPYSTHPLALILKGMIEPEDLHNSPIDIGTGAIFKLDDRNPITYSKDDGDLAKELSEKNTVTKKSSILVYAIIIVVLVLATFVALSIFSCHAKKNHEEVISRRVFWKEAILSKSYYKRKILISLLITCSISLPILAAQPGEFSEFVTSSNYQIKTTMVKKLFDFLVWLDKQLINLLSFFP
ncbi:glycoside hydrolase family 3 N-terminal domain-containing protein [Vibrio coralliilyticus]|uniref:glycoside hydrolase family 3 N-terminal domain-containing protein n=1 Tax=Vibrio coralliilyticus TaxID=190893 RepID=UPI0024090BB4|nr:glycoside hydrolase family 3 N-terminal domain-containing protein [Vibrio coralliilyticus]WFB51062.1 glycoside hydrolase family 3 N-terminal domain-containing protein [Vibrio coralliilyticus]